VRLRPGFGDKVLQAHRNRPPIRTRLGGDQGPQQRVPGTDKGKDLVTDLDDFEFEIPFTEMASDDKIADIDISDKFADPIWESDKANLLQGEPWVEVVTKEMAEKNK